MIRIRMFFSRHFGFNHKCIDTYGGSTAYITITMRFFPGIPLIMLHLRVKMFHLRTKRRKSD